MSKANMRSFSLSTSQLVSKSVVHIIQARLSLCVSLLVRAEACVCVCDTSVHRYTPKQMHKDSRCNTSLRTHTFILHQHLFLHVKHVLPVCLCLLLSSKTFVDVGQLLLTKLTLFEKLCIKNVSNNTKLCSFTYSLCSKPYTKTRI